MKVTCGACGACEDAATWSGPLQLRFAGTWRARNSAKSLVAGALVDHPSMVILCSDTCESRYGATYGFADGSQRD